MIENNKGNLKLILNNFHFVNIRMKLSFPSKKLIVYDSGKLNMLTHLLKKLKANNHKVLIFTQVNIITNLSF